MVMGLGNGLSLSCGCAVQEASLSHWNRGALYILFMGCTEFCRYIAVYWYEYKDAHALLDPKPQSIGWSEESSKRVWIKKNDLFYV
jgi:hypothetical protein